MTARLGTNEARGVSRFIPDLGIYVGDLQIRSARTSNLWQTAFSVPAAGGASGAQRAQAIANELNNMFADTNHDADFITPSYRFPADTVTWPNGAYSVIWEHVYGNDTCNTTFAVYGGVIPECLYTGCHVPNCQSTYPRADKNTWQKDLIYVRTEDMNYYNDIPWDLALYFANQIRSLIDGIDARGRSIQSLVVTNLHNFTGDISSKKCRFYLAGEVVNNPWTACFGGAETGHTADLILATDTADLDCNMWIRATDNATGLTVVARATDDSPLGQVEGTAGGLAHALKLSTACTERFVRLHAP